MNDRRNERLSKMVHGKQRLWQNERGGAHILLAALLALAFLILLFVTSIDWMLQSANKTKTKLALDRSTHAAALQIDPYEAANGRLIWLENAGREQFHRYLRMNLRLDEHGAPLPGSHLPETPQVHLLEFVTASAYPAKIQRTVIVHSGTEKETTREVNVTVYGPSIVAVIEVHQKVRGQLEPIVLSSVASVRFR